MTAERLRQAATLLEGLSGEFWSAMTTPRTSADEIGRVVNRIGDAGFDTPELALVTGRLLKAIADVHEDHSRIVADHRQIEAGGGNCGCAYKDCYDCGKWHNCAHRTPLHMTEALAVADAILGEA